jgi:hypothetical protein
MGGSAVLIWGAADPDRLAQRGFFARLLRRREPKEVELFGGRRLTELPADRVQALVPELKSYVRRQVGSPWAATQSMLDYLDIAFEVLVRGQREGDSPRQWYVQLDFGGCGGMAEISSAVAAHWARRWYADEHERIAAILQPSGFVPSRSAGAADELTFLPVGELGYAAFQSEGYSEDDDSPARHFELDSAAIEGNEENAEALLRALEESWVELMSDGRCHCQLCDPGLDLGLLQGLPLGK